jgi:hypothetical protein
MSKPYACSCSFFWCIYLWSSFIFPHRATAPSGPWPSLYRNCTISLRHTTLGRTPLVGRPAPRRSLYLTTHNTHNRKTSMPPARFKPTVSVSERPYVWSSVETEIGRKVLFKTRNWRLSFTRSNRPVQVSTVLVHCSAKGYALLIHLRAKGYKLPFQLVPWPLDKFFWNFMWTFSPKPVGISNYQVYL